MRKSLTFVVALFIATASVASIAAHTQDGKEKVVSDTIVFDTPMRVGTTTLPAGEYKVKCDSKTITFTSTSSKDKKPALTVDCKGKDLAKKADTTLSTTAIDTKGVYLKTLVLHGSTFEHTFN